jgi:hypothetical protein
VKLDVVREHLGRVLESLAKMPPDARTTPLARAAEMACHRALAELADERSGFRGICAGWSDVTPCRRFRATEGA